MEKEWRLPSSGREFDRSLEERVRESATGEAAGTARTPPRRIPSPAGLHGSTSDACTLLLPSRPAAAQRSDVPLAHSWQPIHVLTAVAPPPAQPRNREEGYVGGILGRGMQHHLQIPPPHSSTAARPWVPSINSWVARVQYTCTCMKLTHRHRLLESPTAGQLI